MKKFIKRDISWLYFNERVLRESNNPHLPVLEKLNFLSIFSSNLDEFYKVRIPSLLAIKKSQNADFNNDEHNDTLSKIFDLIESLQAQFGQYFNETIELLKKEKIVLHTKIEEIPHHIIPQLRVAFYQQILSYLVRTPLTENHKSFFPTNNQLYLLVQSKINGEGLNYVVNIPSNKINRFVHIKSNEDHFVFIDDVIKLFLHEVFPSEEIVNIGSFKITRNADLNLEDDYEGDLLVEIEQLLKKRNNGLATRFLYDPMLHENSVNYLIKFLRIKKADIVAGGQYHHMSDLNQIKVDQPHLYYPKWEISNPFTLRLLEKIREKDIIVHTPFQSYQTILQCFNEAAIDPNVNKIYVSLYRVAKKSSIVESLISAAQNGKQVYVLMELKARFDEENNIKWSKKLKANGVNVIYTKANWKVHAKIALIVKKGDLGTNRIGIISTGNFNETTAKFYTDHSLVTANESLTKELQKLFDILVEGEDKNATQFKHLLVSPYNLQEKFFELIDFEMEQAKANKKAFISIKLNNLEEKKLIKKLINAAEAGVTVKLFVRSICCINPTYHENIEVIRVLDRYLEHGRVFHFYHQNENLVYMGSADWMNRNIYKRIEVCTPILDQQIKDEFIQILATYWNKDSQVVHIHSNGSNLYPPKFHQSKDTAQFKLSAILNHHNND